MARNVDKLSLLSCIRQKPSTIAVICSFSVLHLWTTPTYHNYYNKALLRMRLLAECIIKGVHSYKGVVNNSLQQGTLSRWNYEEN